VATPSYGLTPRLRSSCQQAKALTRADGGRYVDLGIEIRVVRQDVEGGAVFLVGKPPLRPVAVHHVGGIWDTIERRFVEEDEGDRSSCPLVWYVGERQAALLLGIWANPLSGTRWLLVSAEGGGKTVTMSQALWVFVLALSKLGIFGAIGVTAPTHTRLDTFIKAICDQAVVDAPNNPKPDAFGTFYTATKDIRAVTGHTIQPRGTKKASEATGSPVQGFTWLGSFDDELQDTVANGADADIEARLRGAENSIRVCTATAKDSSGWRSFRESKGASPDWKIERIRFNENPFVWPAHWERLKRNVSAREWQRRGLAMDVGPERMVYTAWEREKNLRPVPAPWAEDITASELAGYGRNIGVLVGYDPGKLFDVSVVLKAYRLPKSGAVHWWVVDELTTEQSTSEQHAQALMKLLREKWGVHRLDLRGRPLDGSPVALVRADPYGDSAEKPDRSVYTVFKQFGFDIRPAAYSPVRQGGQAIQAPGAGRIGREERIELVNTLLCNANGDRRLFVACDDHRQPVAPKLVESIEMSERDEGGKAEAVKKNAYDLTHWSAALGYGLWAVERPRMRITGPA
jgi:hypothetical protein